jgi:hypothetical protein
MKQITWGVAILRAGRPTCRKTTRGTCRARNQFCHPIKINHVKTLARKGESFKLFMGTVRLIQTSLIFQRGAAVQMEQKLPLLGVELSAVNCGHPTHLRSLDHFVDRKTVPLVD